MFEFNVIRRYVDESRGTSEIMLLEINSNKIYVATSNSNCQYTIMDSRNKEVGTSGKIEDLQLRDSIAAVIVKLAYNLVD